MDSETYHFDKDDINLTHVQKSESEISSFTENHEENAYETLNYKDEFQSFNHENFSEATIEVLDAKINLCENENHVETPTSVSHPIVAQNQTLDHDEQLNKSNEISKNDAPSSVFRQEEPPKGSSRLVRLQAASDSTAKNCSDVGCDIAVPNADSGVISAGDTSEGISENKISDGADSQPIVLSEAQCEFLSSQMNSLNHPIYLTSNSGENVLISEIPYQPVIQSEDPNTPHTSNATQEQIVFNISDTTVSDLTMPRIEKVQTCSSTDPKAPMWIVDSDERCDNSGTSGNTNDDSSLKFYENSQDISSDYQSPVNTDEIPDTQQMQRFITADNQVVYGYKDANGEFHFFCPAMNERESHNEKERKRRSRVSDACSTLRKLIPGITEKTDKATVFEQAAMYLKFLRGKFGTQFDQIYCEKYFQEKS